MVLETLGLQLLLFLRDRHETLNLLYERQPCCTDSRHSIYSFFNGSQMAVTQPSHTCQSHMPVTHASHTCQSHMPVTYASHTCQSHMPITHASHSCQHYDFNTDKVCNSLRIQVLFDTCAIDQFRYIKIQPKSIDLSTRFLGINPTNSVFIPTSLALRSIVLG